MPFRGYCCKHNTKSSRPNSWSAFGNNPSHIQNVSTIYLAFPTVNSRKWFPRKSIRAASFPFHVISSSMPWFGRRTTLIATYTLCAIKTILSIWCYPHQSECSTSTRTTPCSLFVNTHTVLKTVTMFFGVPVYLLHSCSTGMGTSTHFPGQWSVPPQPAGTPVCWPTGPVPGDWEREAPSCYLGRLVWTAGAACTFSSYSWGEHPCTPMMLNFTYHIVGTKVSVQTY